MLELLLNARKINRDYSNLYLGVPWTSYTTTSPNVIHASCAKVNGKNYTFGGVTATYLNNSYHKTGRTVGTAIAPLPSPTMGHTSVSANGKIYIFAGLLASANGNESKYCYVYDPISNTYSNLPNMPENFCFGHGSAIGTDIYLIGGTTSYGAVSTPSATTAQNFWKFDTLTNTFTKLPWPNIPFRLACGVVNIGDKLWVYGGRGGATSNILYSDLSVYDPVTQEWEYITDQINPPPGRACRNAIVVLGKCFMVTGGQIAASGNFYSDSCMLYNTETNTWITLANLPTRWGWGTLTEINDTIYLNQGVTGTGTGVSGNQVYELKPY